MVTTWIDIVPLLVALIVETGTAIVVDHPDLGIDALEISSKTMHVTKMM